MEMYSRQMTDNINCFTGTGSFYGSDARKVRAASDLIQEEGDPKGHSLFHSIIRSG